MALTRWMATLASFYVMIVSCGSLNTFSLFSQYMRDTLGYDQQDINTISFFKEMGTSVGIISGFLYNVSGAWFILLISACLNFIGYFIIWLCLTSKIPQPEVWQVCFYICLIGASAAFTITAVLVTCANNFTKNRGMILSLLDSTNGLAVAIFTLLFQAFFAKTSANASAFVLLLGSFPSAVILALLGLVRELPNNVTNTNDLKNMYLFLFFTVLLALYLMLVILLQHNLHLTPSTIKCLFGGMVLIHLLPIPIILRSECAFRETGMTDTGLNVDGDTEQNQSTFETTENMKRPEYGDDFSILQALKSMDLWLIIIATTCGVGAALTVNNNMGQIGLSLGYSQVHTNTFVALLNIWDFIGGVATGFLSDILLKKWGVPRPFFFALALGILGSGNLVIGLAIPGALFLGSILVGISLGAQWAVLFTIIAEIFGLKNYATLQNIPTIAKGVGIYCLSVKLAGLLYDQEANKESRRTRHFGVASSNKTCFGSQCYRHTFFIMSVVCVLGCLASSLLAVRTRKFYKNVMRQNEV